MCVERVGWGRSLVYSCGTPLEKWEGVEQNFKNDDYIWLENFKFISRHD